MSKNVCRYFWIAVLLLAGVNSACAVSQYSGNAQKVLPATVRIIAGDSLGSGVVVGKAGLVLTSNHVMAGSKTAEVFFADGARYLGQLLLNDARKDLALIQVEGAGIQLPCANLGNSQESDDLQIGDYLEIIGYPAFTGSEAPAVTGGQISGFPGIESVRYIQTCASVYPGNSGGPVINRYGEVIGIVNGKYTDASDRCATFATAINEAESLITQANGKGQLNQGPGKSSTSVTGQAYTECPNVGCRAPGFTLVSISGESYAMQTLKGKKSILIFTGGDYTAMSRSLECLSRLYAAWPRAQLEMLLVARQGKNDELVGWARSNGIKFPVLADPGGEITRVYGVESFPAYYFVNAYGDIRIKRTSAADLCYAEMDALLRLY